MIELACSARGHGEESLSSQRYYTIRPSLTGLPDLWAAANLAERRSLLLTVLDAVYVDVRGAKAVVSVKPKAMFEAVLAESRALTASVPYVA